MARTRAARLALLGTHVVCWLYAGRIDLLSAGAQRLVESAQIAISPIVRLELQYLFEIKRITRRADQILNTLAADIGLTVRQEPFDGVVKAANSVAWTRNPFDRLQVGHAQLIRAAFITRDELIRARFSAAVW
jgi:PIN domain nuclease of toxin-antitoxin system